MTLQASLDSTYTSLHAALPPHISTTIRRTACENQATFDLTRVIQPGSQLPEFNLPSTTSLSPSASSSQSSSSTSASISTLNLSSLLAKGPLLITFYRGSWCPFCMTYLNAIQNIHKTIQAKGANFIAITAELPASTLATVKEHNFTFPILSDSGNTYSRELGLVFRQDPELTGAYEELGIGWEGRYGVCGVDGDGEGEGLEVVVPCTLLVGRGGRVERVWCSANFVTRLEPDLALEWIDDLNASENASQLGNGNSNLETETRKPQHERVQEEGRVS